jgi:hypothetical protein
VTFWRSALIVATTPAILPVSGGESCRLIEATQADGNLLWSAPIWVTVTD